MGTMFRVASSDTPNHAHMKSSTGRHLLRTQTYQDHSEKYPDCILNDDGNWWHLPENLHFSMILHDSPCNYKQFLLGFLQFFSNIFLSCGLTGTRGTLKAARNTIYCFITWTSQLPTRKRCRTCRNVRFASFCIDSTILCWGNLVWHSLTWRDCEAFVKHLQSIAENLILRRITWTSKWRQKWLARIQLKERSALWPLAGDLAPWHSMAYECLWCHINP